MATPRATPTPSRWGLWLSATTALVASLAAFVLIGSHVVALGGPSTGALAGAYVVAVLASFLLPALLGARVAGAEAKLPIVVGAVAAFDLLWLALLLGLAPAASRLALTDHGDWFLAQNDVPAVRDAVRTLATWIPRSEAAPITSEGGDAVPEVQGTADAGVPDAALPEIAAPPVIAAPPPVTPPEPWTARELFAQRADSVVTIQVRRPLDTEDLFADLFERLGISDLEVSGSGIVVSADGLIVTNHHVVRDGENARVVLRDGRIFDVVRVLAIDPANDVDLIAIDAASLPFAPLAPEAELEVGATLFAIGSPLGLDHTLTEGIVSAIRVEGGTHLVQTQAPIAPGSSGGPLFDDLGRVVGINTSTRSAGMNFAVDVRHVRALLAAPREPRELARYVPGVHAVGLTMSGAPLEPTTRAMLEQIAVGVARVAGGCITAWPDAGPAVTLEIGRTRRDDVLRSDQGEEVDRCLGDHGSSLLMAAGIRMRAASHEAFSVAARVEGIGSDGSHAIDVSLALAR